MAKKKAESETPIEMAKARELIDRLLTEFYDEIGTGSAYGKGVAGFATGKSILELNRASQTVAIVATLDSIAEAAKEIDELRPKEGEPFPNTPDWIRRWNGQWFRRTVIETLLKRKLPFDEQSLVRLVSWTIGDPTLSVNFSVLTGAVSAIENFVESPGMTPTIREGIDKFIPHLNRSNDKVSRKLVDRLNALITTGPTIHLEPGEAWSDSALADLVGMTGNAKASWQTFLIACQTGGAGKFTPKWKKEVDPLLEAVGFDSLKEHLLRWFPLVDKPRTSPKTGLYQQDLAHHLEPAHVELLRGLVWCCGFHEDSDLARALAKLALSSYRKVPGIGPRLVSLGNACVTSLGMMPGLSPIGQLAVLKVKVKFGTAQKEIEKAFNAAATRENLPREEIEEMAVPTYGLEEVGTLRESFGDYLAELTVDGSSASLRWSKDAKVLKTVPAAVKKEHDEAFKELHGSLKDINAMLPAQRERIDSLFLAQKSWPLSVWKERYLDHPLVGTISRRLIWTFTTGEETVHGVWLKGQLVNESDSPLSIPEEAKVSLWHPIGHPMVEVLVWREWFERHEVIQPFKQAHREVYLLTDAERNTRTYSNRFAAHVLKQHQFNALCLARGWKNQLRLMVDAEYPPAHRTLPLWNLRAEYWVEGAGTNYGVDTNETGTYFYLTTDQVRFYHLGAPQLFAHAGGGGYGRYQQALDEPVPLDMIPPLVFSEIMRDVDLFVGVASVGNDPNWNDGGPNGRHVDYWHSYSFGELSATAQTRKSLLQRLVPRLKIAARCSFEDRFLLVRGDIRTYKIHLGSGNILMLPNDQYLCIVPKQTISGTEKVFLPFEGDNTLSIILSKAFLLAEDTKISDPTIVSQLKK